ncbi:MAG: ankyrin repeat domain-containing protein [Gammaproteobacteria bacterium]|nr:ankyrin repeat domain-containing protein [Gammaproteobacteria bacterium]
MKLTDQQKFFHAVGNNSVETVKNMILHGLDIETRDDRGRTALLLATQIDVAEVARVLMEAGADVNAKDNIDDSPFLYAGAEGRLEILQMMLKHGADLASVNRYGGTALIPAAHHGHIETVRELLKTGIDIDHINFLGWTALLETVILGDGGPTYIEITRLLVKAGADVNITDNENVSPLEHAQSRGFDEIAALIRAAK